VTLARTCSRFEPADLRILQAFDAAVAAGTAPAMWLVAPYSGVGAAPWVQPTLGRAALQRLLACARSSLDALQVDSLLGIFSTNTCLKALGWLLAAASCAWSRVHCKFDLLCHVAAREDDADGVR